MDETTLIINRVLPVFALIGLGYWIQRSQFLPESTLEDLRKIAVNFALPAVLFISFLNIDLELTYLVTFVIVFGLCVLLFFLGRLLRAQLKIDHPYFPYLMTGFEYGMLGVSFFGSVYGLENIGFIAIIDLGHEIFIWFVFLALLLMLRDGTQNPGALARSFFSSPVIIAILLGIGLNLAGARAFLYESAVTGGIIATLEFLSNLTIPLILIIVGYGIKFDRANLREALLVVGVRLVILVPLALVLNAVVIRELLGLAPGFEAALFTLLVLPPPFIIPLYMKRGMPQERQYVNTVLTVYTLVSLLIFAVYFVGNPVI